MHLPESARHLLYSALLLLVLSGTGGIHSHVHLDELELPATVHFENVKAHGHHHDDEEAHDDHENPHVDVENRWLPHVLPGKHLDQDSPLFLTAVFFLFCLRLPQRPNYSEHHILDFHHPPRDLLPPLRAPPFKPR